MKNLNLSKTKINTLEMALGVALLALLPALSMAPTATAAARCKTPSFVSELTWANGTLVCMSGGTVVMNPSPGLVKAAEPLWLAVFMPLPDGCDTATQTGCSPESVGGGYLPQCNPCFHGGSLNDYPYHDHIVNGIPGAGKHGTAGTFLAPWNAIIIVYDTTYSSSSGFVPAKSAADVVYGEAHGWFQIINPDGPNVYEIDTGAVVICTVTQAIS